MYEIIVKSVYKFSIIALLFIASYMTRKSNAKASDVYTAAGLLGLLITFGNIFDCDTHQLYMIICNRNKIASNELYTNIFVLPAACVPEHASFNRGFMLTTGQRYSSLGPNRAKEIA